MADTDVGPLDKALQAVVATGPDGRITYWNRAAERLYGWTAREIMGRDVMEVTTPDRGAGENTLRPVEQRDERAFQARAALSERTLHYNALFEAMSEGFALCQGIFDVDGRLADYAILEINPALQRMLSVGPEAVGTTLRDAPGDHTRWLAPCERVLLTGRPSEFEYHHLASDRRHEVRVSRVGADQMAHFFFDITERKQAQARQAELFNELNHRVMNNLSLVSGILRMKARATEYYVVRDQLLRAVARVQIIALVNRALYLGHAGTT